jgi:hypothetical protein
MQHLNNIEKSPKYMALPDDRKAALRGHLYDKYIVPSFKARGLEVPPKDEWVAKKFKNPNQLSWKNIVFPLITRTPAGNLPIAEMGAAAAGSIAKLAKGALSAEQYMTDLVEGREDPKSSRVHQWIDEQKRLADKVSDRVDDYMGDNYDDSIRTRFARFAGGELPKLPLYEIGGPLVKGLESGLGIEAIFNTGRIAPFVAKYLHNTADWFIVNKVTGQETSDAFKDAAIMGGLSQGKVAYKAAREGLPAARKYIADIFAAGGAPLVKQTLKWADDIGVRQQLAKEHIEWYDELNKYISGNKPYGPGELKTKLGEATLKVSNLIAREKFKVTAYQFLKPEQKKAVIDEVIGMMHDAQNKIVHEVPGVAKKVVKESVEKQVSENPYFAKTTQKLASVGRNVIEDNAEAAVEHSAMSDKQHHTRTVLDKIAKGVNVLGKSEEQKVQHQLEAINARVEGELPGAAGIDSPEFDRNILHMVKLDMKLESPKHQIAFLYGIRNKFEKPIRNRIVEIMKNMYPPSKGFTNKDYGKMVEELKTIMGRITVGIENDVPEITKHGNKMFRSHKLEGPRTKWTNDLFDLTEGQD